MKTQYLISSFIIVLIATVSCKKNYTCGCIQTVTYPAYTYNNQTYPEQIIISSFTNSYKSKKNEAESDCKMGESFNSRPSTHAAQGQGPTTDIITCELK